MSRFPLPSVFGRPTIGRLCWWIFLGALACRPAETKVLIPAFYHWRTTYNPSPAEQEQLRRLNVRRLYLHFFDVDRDTRSGEAIPKAMVRFGARPTGLEVIPVVFITNRTLLRYQPAQVAVLARRILEKIQFIARQNGISFAEVQLDCDWTGQTRSAYFALLREFRRRYAGRLSATIRLHQVKYRERTGVPPVDRGMLMVYNMADWQRADVRNSIYDPAVAERYLASLDRYPLPLDAVFPLFRWTVVYRTNRFLTFVNNLDRRRLATYSFLEPVAGSPVAGHRFVARRDTTAFGFSVRRGDLFRTEECEPGELLEGKRRVLAKIQNQPLTFALYHLDSTVLAPYSHEFLQTLFRSSP